MSDEDQDDEFYPAGTTIKAPPTFKEENLAAKMECDIMTYDKDMKPVPEESEPSHIEDVPDDDLTDEQVEHAEVFIDELKEALAENIAPTELGFEIDLGELPASSRERIDIAVGILRAVERSLELVDGDVTPEIVKRYTEQLQSMLDGGITLYNLILGKWSMEKVYQVNQGVYFSYYGVWHLGHVESVAKSRVLIRFKLPNKDRPNDSPREVLTWRDKTQVKVP
jgi:hypothetical protein